MNESELTVSEALASRRSSRSFLDKPIEEEKLRRVLTAGQWAASGNNSQPWKFLLVRDEQARARVCDGLAPGNAVWAKHAPAFLIVAARPEDSRYHNRDGKQYYLYECGLAVQNMVIQATGLGLMMHQLGNFTEDLVRAAVNIPSDFKVVIVIPIGYEGPRDDLPEDVRARDSQPRVRRELDEMVYYDSWPETIAASSS